METNNNDNQSPMNSTTPNQTPESQTPPVAPSPENRESSESSKKGSSKMLWLGAFAIIAVGIVVALFFTGVVDVKKLTEGASGGDAVAMVNGAPVSREDYDQQVKQAEAFLASMGSTDQTQNQEFLAQLKQRIIDDLVNGELLMQKAGEAGIEATPEDIDAQYQKTAEQLGGEEALSAQLATIGLTDEKLREILRKQVVIERFINANTEAENIAVTEEELKSFYDQSFMATEEAARPAFEEVREQLTEQVKQQKSSVIVNAFIEELRQGAEIEILI